MALSLSLSHSRIRPDQIIASDRNLKKKNLASINEEFVCACVCGRVGLLTTVEEIANPPEEN